MVGALQLLSSEGGTFNDMLKQISSSSGLLDESFSKMADTSEFKLASAINNLKNSFIEIGGAFAPVIDGIANVISNIADVINGLGGGVKTVIGYVTGFTAVLSPILGIIGKVIGGLGKFSEYFSSAKWLNEKGFGNIFTKNFEKIGTATTTLSNKTIKALTQWNKKVDEVGYDTSKSLGDIADDILDKVGEPPKFTIETNVDDVLDGVNKSASKLSGIFKTLWGVMTAHPYATIAGGIALVVAALVAYKNIAEKIKQKKIDDLQLKIKTEKEEIQNEEEKLKTLRGIAEEYDTLYNKINKTKEEEERLKELTAQIAELYPELIESYDENGDPILKLNGNAETYISTLERAIEKQEELLSKDENELADKQKEQLGGIKERQQGYESKKDEYENLDTPNYAYQDRLKEEQSEYDKALQAYKDYNEAKLDINEGYLNELQTTNDYINSTAKEKENLDSLYRDTFDFANLWDSQGEAGVDKFISQTDKLKKAMIDSSELSEENAKSIEKMQDSFGKTNNLGKYTDGLTELYETSGKFDKNSLETWFNSVEEYASSTGDLEGANAQVKEMAQTLEKMTGIDSSIWEDLFHINAEPLTVAEERMHSFLEAYGTGAGNLGKGGLADNLEQEFNTLESLTDKLTNEYKDGIDIDTAVRLTNNAPAPIKNMVDEMIKENGVIDTELLTQASIEIRNQGEISEDTKAKLKEIFPDKTDEEIEALFTVEADVKNQEEIENLLGQWDDLDLDIKSKIRAEVDNGEEAQQLYDLIKDLPKEKQIQVINDFSNAKEEARLLGVEIDDLPLEKKLQYHTVFKDNEQIQNIKKTLDEIPDEVETSITTEMEQAGKLEDFYLAIENIDGKKVTAFLQQEGAVEALLECENIQEMMDLINGKKAIGEVDVNTDTADDTIHGTKTSFEDLDGTTATGVITVESEDEALQQTQGTLVELDGQQYLVVVNVDTGEKELVPFKQELNTLPNEKNVNISATDNASGTLGIVASITIGDKTFSVNCSDLATAVIVGVINQIIPGKMFDITCTDNASSKVGTVEGLKIGDKSFSISAIDNASSVISTIKSALDKVKSKTVSVWTKYFSTGKESAVKDPEIVTLEAQAVGQPIVLDDFNNKIAQAQASVQSSANAYANTQNDAIATIQGSSGFTDTILASSYWSNQAVDHSLDLLMDYTAQLDRLGNKLDITSAKIENAFGTSKANLLKDQIKLLEQQQAMLKLQQKDAQTLANSYKSMLKKQGFKVDGNGAVTNATSKILELEHALEKAEKAQDSYNGKSESKQKSLAKSVENAQEKLNKAKDTLSEYYEYSSLVGETEAEWREIANAIADVKNEIYLANKEQALFYKEAKTTELEYSYDKLSDQLDILQSKMDLERNEGNIDLIKEEISLLKQMQIENEKVEASYRNQMHYYKNYLSGKGFSFDNDGNITNGANALNKNKASDEIESIQDAYESYMELQRDTIPDLEKDWWDLEKSIEDANDKIKEAEEELERLEKEMKELEKIKAFDFLDDLEHKQEQLEGTLSLLSAQMENAFGYEKQQLMEQQIGLLEEQMSNINHINQGLKDQLSYLKQAMQSDGFTFDSKGNITNADTILALAQTQDEYDELKEKVEEYQDVQNQVTSNKTEWQNLQNEIIDTQREIENLKYEIEDMREEAEIRELTNDFQILENELNRLQAELELNGANTTAIYEQQIAVIEKQKKAIDEQISYQKKRANELANNLYEYGFKINDNGTIDNTANQLEYLKDTLAEDEFERVNGYLEEYFDVALSEIPNLENEMLGLNKAIQDIEEEKLNKAKEIEDEITEILEKQIDERIEKIEEERDAQIDAISKAKDAYDKWRRDVDYEDDYNEQLEKVQELQAQLEIAKRDDSLSGQKRVADLMEQLKEEQENLEDLVQDRTDTVINDMFDSQIENVEDNAEAQIKNIENVFSETKIAEMVAEAMKTGIFEDIDGNIKSLDTALLDMANNSVEYMGVLGDGLKNELLDNLSVALDYMQQMEKVSINLSNIDYQSQMYAGIGYDKATVQGEIINNTTTDNSSRVVNVEFNPTIQIEGTTDLDEVQLRGILSDVKTDMIAEVQRQILSNMK